MKKLGKLKLNALNEQDLKEKQMNALRGGQICYCSCYWENVPNSNGSSTSDNRSANYNSGYYSQHGCNQYANVDGYTYTCLNCNENASGAGDIYYG
ncbi:MAG: TIGR04149 family rSAM-modified RiPP [Prevotellaceae bacterium]|jgi:natural product precursor|nr:TIGR04149 family rSAM-modified RiPP [Prevotellaceae bacterium]